MLLLMPSILLELILYEGLYLKAPHLCLTFRPLYYDAVKHHIMSERLLNRRHKIKNTQQEKKTGLLKN